MTLRQFLKNVMESLDELLVMGSQLVTMPDGYCFLAAFHKMGRPTNRTKRVT